MNVADEASGAHLYAEVQNERTVAEIPLPKAIGAINRCFKKWGMPHQIKIDNGLPFVNPKNRDLPTYAKLWWIGLGINVIQNHPNVPQQNGIVECLQGTLCNWSNPKEQKSVGALQKRINQESDFQRNAYRIPAKGGKTRLEMYPELVSNLRKYAPNQFRIERVHEYLAERVWERRVKKNGEIRFWGVHIYIGKKFARYKVNLTLDPLKLQWLIRLENGTLVKTSKQNIPTEEGIKKIALMSKNFSTT